MTALEIILTVALIASISLNAALGYAYMRLLDNATSPPPGHPFRRPADDDPEIP